MRIFATILVIGLSYFISSASGAVVQVSQFIDQDWVRVRLESSRTEVRISGYAISIQGDENIAKPVALSRALETVQIFKETRSGKSFWRVISDQNKNVKIYAQPFLKITGVGLHSGGNSLPGQVFLYGKEKFDLIGRIRFREYLFGVVAKEMPIYWPLEALKAQAIAARSYALSIIKKRKNKPYQLESSILDQVFAHFDTRDLDSSRFARVLKAVDETEGIVLINKKNEVLQAFYHADCGGKTASSKTALGVEGLRGGAVDKSCPMNPKAKWSFRISKENLARALQQSFSVASLDLVFFPNEDRVQNILVHSKKGEDHLIRAFDFRELIGYQEIRSTRFVVKKEQNNFVFSGLGFGHGVGLCQWGSRSMAIQGASVAKILNHYYPEAALESRKYLQSEEPDRYNNQHVFN